MLALTIAVIVRKQSCVSTEKTNQNAAKAYAFTRRDRARASERERERERERLEAWGGWETASHFFVGKDNVMHVVTLIGIQPPIVVLSECVGSIGACWRKVQRYRHLPQHAQ
jgi:hypothetical protein